MFLGFGTVLSRVGYLFVSVNVGGIFNIPLQTYNIIRCYDGTFIIPPNGPRAGPTHPARILKGAGEAVFLNYAFAIIILLVPCTL